MTTTSPAITATATDHPPRYVRISSWSVPALVAAGFSMVAILPVALVAIGVARDARLSRLRLPAALLTATYATPLAIYLLRDDPARSLSRDMHPAFIPLIVAAAAWVLYRTYSRRA
jgi:hypothetical protein